MSVLIGEPGRPVWPLWEILKHVFGKSDHTMAAIGNWAHICIPSVFVGIELCLYNFLSHLFFYFIFLS